MQRPVERVATRLERAILYVGIVDMIDLITGVIQGEVQARDFVLVEPPKVGLWKGVPAQAAPRQKQGHAPTRRLPWIQDVLGSADETQCLGHGAIHVPVFGPAVRERALPLAAGE